MPVGRKARSGVQLVLPIETRDKGPRSQMHLIRDEGKRPTVAGEQQKLNPLLALPCNFGHTLSDVIDAK